MDGQIGARVMGGVLGCGMEGLSIGVGGEFHLVFTVKREREVRSHGVRSKYETRVHRQALLERE